MRNTFGFPFSQLIINQWQADHLKLQLKNMDDLFEDLDLNEEEAETPVEESDNEQASPEEDDLLKNEDDDQEEGGTPQEEAKPEEDAGKQADDLLKDGTPADKDIRVKKSKYDELVQKAEMFEASAPLLGKLSQKPEVVKEVMQGEQNVEDRLAQLEEQSKAKERAELKQVVTSAIQLWPDFRAKWAEIQPLFRSLEKSGLSKADALQRAYFAVNPEAVKSESRLIAQKTENLSGVNFSAGGVGAKKVAQENFDDVQIPQEDIDFAREAGIPLDVYKRNYQYVDKFKDL